MAKKNFFNDKFFIFGHRGFSENYPENTMASFRACSCIPEVDGIELDVHLCKTGEVVVAHDFSLKRTAGIDKEIENLSFEELQKIDVGSFKGKEFSSERIPLLEDIFKTFGTRFYYDVELKVKAGEINVELCRKVQLLIYKYNLEEKVMVSSFNPFALKCFKILTGGKIETADIFLDSPTIPKPFRYGGGRFISLSTYLKPQYDEINLTFCLKNGNIPLITWTVNTQEEAKQLLVWKKRGCNLRGMIGNNPQILIKTIKEANF